MSFKSLSGSNTSLLIKIGAITLNTFLPVRNKFVFSCSIKICASFYALLESIFCLLLVVEAFSLEKVIEMVEEVISLDERSGEYGREDDTS